MHFYCDKRKYCKKWIFLFHRQITLYWQRHKYRFQLSLVKKNDNQNFKTLISFSCQTLFFIYSQHFIKKIVFSRFGHGLQVRETGREGAGRLNSSTGFQNLAHYFFQMAPKHIKLDSNGVQIAIVYFRKNIKIARQLLAPLPDPVYDAH